LRAIMSKPPIVSNLSRGPPCVHEGLMMILITAAFLASLAPGEYTGGRTKLCVRS
jgi:hypothetical protein